MGGFGRYCGWTKSILHHLRNPGTIRFPCKYQQKQWFQPWFQSGANAFCPSSVWRSRNFKPFLRCFPAEFEVIPYLFLKLTNVRVSHGFWALLWTDEILHHPCKYQQKQWFALVSKWCETDFAPIHSHRYPFGCFT